MKDDRSGRVAGVVLAAGTSSRMGRNKLFLPLGGTSVLRRAVATAHDAGLDPVLVVLGHESDRALAELAGLLCAPVVNAEFARGMNSSVRAGISAVPEDASGAVLMLADMPFVTAAMLRALVDRYRAAETPLAARVDLAGVPDVATVEVREQGVQEDHLRVGGLPEQEVRGALLT